MTGTATMTPEELEEGKSHEYEMVPKKEETVTETGLVVRLPPDIEWVHVNMSVHNGKKKILQDCWGSVKSGTVCGLLGGSGAGKSCLLNVISGRQTAGRGVEIEGKITVAGKVIHPVDFRKNIAYVMQDDALMATATPREALRFSATLRLPQATSITEIHDFVEKLIDELDLKKCADTIIGNALIKGCSGGERKRTSIGIELITNPLLLFLDEPTSGLDSYSASHLLHLLKKMALKGCTVITILHQPSAELLFLCDSVIFMKAGRIFYQGAPLNTIKYFASFGYDCPENYNPADYVMSILQVTSVEEFDKKNMFMQCPHELLDTNGIVKWGPQEKNFNAESTFSRQYTMLTYREFCNVIRDKGVLGARFGATIFLNLLIGLIFLNVGKGDNGNFTDINAHFGALMLTLMFTMMAASQPVALAFPAERPIFLREYSVSTYGASAYFLSKLSIEAPMAFLQTIVAFTLSYNMVGLQGNFILIVLSAWGLSMASCSVAVMLGCSVPDVNQIMEFAPLFFVPQVLFAGFFIRTSMIPVFLRWAQYLCSLKYAMNLTLLIEFRADSPSCSTSPAAHFNCNNIIQSNNINPKEFWVYIIVLCALLTN